MRIPDALVLKLLSSSRLASEEQLNALREQVVTEKKPLQDLAIKDNIISEKDLTRLYATEIDVPYIELNPREVNKDLLRQIPERVARQYGVVLFGQANGGYQLAMEDPDDIQAVSFLKKLLGDQIQVYLAPTTNIQNTLDQYRGNIGTELTKVIQPETIGDELEDEQIDEKDLAEDSPIAKTVNLLIEYAVKSNASDVHIEPREENVVVRYRVDGVLREANKLPKKVLGALVSRIKILANLKIDEHRAPQDGRFKLQINGQLYAMRVSTLPITEGEKVVMRILSESNKPATLEELGYWGYSLIRINKAIQQPHGMVLVTGPTGSGKSTSLYSILSLLNKPSVNISTVEDPVEYKIPGANQTQVNPKAGMTFASGLRAMLRQDPNIIMVGEIRDSETADLGVQAALTGHLVFATLHTNNAATCLPRLLDMGIEPFLIASTVRAVVGQRLVRKLCLECREQVAPDDAMLKKLAEIFGIGNPAVLSHIHDLEVEADKEGIGKTPGVKPKIPAETLSTTTTKITRLWRAHDEGCEACGHIGYKGRIGIYEVLDNSVEVQRLITSRATSDNIQQQAIKEGMITMHIDGFIKALRGLTSVEEILRVTTEN